jgi:hypothetical protein
MTVQAERNTFIAPDHGSVREESIPYSNDGSQEWKYEIPN